MLPEPQKKKLKEPEKYSGNAGGMEWPHYLSLFEEVAAWNGWDPSEKAKQLKMSCRGEALRAIHDLPAEYHHSYQALVDCLQRQFYPKGQEAIFQSELALQMRRKGETPLEFGTALMRLAAKAYPAATPLAREPWIVRQFLDGLGSETAKIQVGLQKPQTMQEAMQLASEYEALAQPRRQNRPAGVNAVNQNPTSQDLQEQMMRLQEELRQLKAKKLASPRRTEKPWLSSIECYSCHQQGHFARNCRKKTTAPTRTGPGDPETKALKSCLGQKVQYTAKAHAVTIHNQTEDNTTVDPLK